MLGLVNVRNASTAGRERRRTEETGQEPIAGPVSVAERENREKTKKDEPEDEEAGEVGRHDDRSLQEDEDGQGDDVNRVAAEVRGFL
jgi:hypothetical protein